jgi:hypothetical protein
VTPAQEAGWWRSQLQALSPADRRAVHDLLDRLDQADQLVPDSPAIFRV